MLEEIVSTGKLKRALVGFSIRDVEMPKEEAVFRLIRSGLAKNMKQAITLLNSYSNTRVNYSAFGKFVLSRTRQGYRMEIYFLDNVLVNPKH